VTSQPRPVLRQQGDQLTVLSHGIASQVEEHAKWGGVVPEIASRRHVEALPRLVELALEDAGLVAADLDAIAATVAPGLVGALMVGSITGRTLAALHQKPFLAVHHLEAHLASVFLAEDPPQAPYLVLLVSGGHTELIRVDQHGEMERLGRSHDDAAGEAFDKVARLMGLGYPGGPAIQAIAVEGDAKRFRLPKGRVSKPEGGFYPYDFSFSGLKTAVLRHVEALKRESDELPLADLAASFEQIVADVLVERSMRCCSELGLKHFSDGGWRCREPSLAFSNACCRTDQGGVCAHRPFGLLHGQRCNGCRSGIASALKRRGAQLSGARSLSAMAIRESIKPLWPYSPLLNFSLKVASPEILLMAPKTDLQQKVVAEPIDPIELNAWKRGFTPQAEIWNGRLAMLGLSIGMATLFIVRMFNNAA
jgi:N6-L-threonylcarbamoyladenine synthase